MKATLRAVDAEEKFILEQNKKQLFDDGEDSRNKRLADYATNRYKALKRRLNPNGVTDLNLSGTHYRGFKMDRGKFPKEIFSTAPVSKFLIGRYGADIYGLTDDSIEETRKRTDERILKDWAKFIKSV